MLWITPPGSLAIENWLSQHRESSPSNHPFFEGRAVKARGWLFWGPQNTLANYPGSKPLHWRVLGDSLKHFLGNRGSQNPTPFFHLNLVKWSGFATIKACPTHRAHRVYWLTFLTQMPHQTSVHMPVPWILCLCYRQTGGNNWYDQPQIHLT